MADELPFASLESASEALRRGRISALALADLVLERIERYNGSLGALSDVMVDSARREARRADLLRSRGQSPSPLAGVPVAVKDIIDTTPAICSAGLSFLADYRPVRDAAVVRRLRRAGAVIIGVTTSDPGAFGVRTAAVTHPQAPNLTVGGSSGGSGAALAAGFCFGALGTDTGGSIRIPAACCAVAGLKPTRGRLPLKGVRPLVWSLDHVGPMARGVADLVPLQAVLDPSSYRRPRGHRSQSVTVGHDPEYYGDAASDVKSAVEWALRAYRDMGCDVREVRLPSPEDALSIHLVIFAAESAAYHSTTFPGKRDRYPTDARSLLDLNTRYQGSDYVLAMRHRGELTRSVEAAFREVDWLILPTLPILPPRKDADSVVIEEKPVDFTAAMVRYTCLFDHTGHPVVAMPAAVHGPGLSVGIQLIGPLAADAALLDLATALERALGLAIDYRLSP